MKNALTKLIKVKSIISIVLTGLITYLGINGTLPSDKVYEIYLIIIGFYFGSQKLKD